MKIPLNKLDSHYSLPGTNNSELRISQAPWYLNLVSESVYLYTTQSTVYFLPAVNTFGINKVIVPPYIQRIDPITLDDSLPVFPEEILYDFPCGLISHSKKMNTINFPLIETKRNNYILNLNVSYESLYSGYNKGHKINLKQSATNDILIQSSNDLKEFTDFYFQNTKINLPSKFKNKHILNNLLLACFSHNAGMIFLAKNRHGQILAAAFFTIYNKRLTYLISCSSTAGKKEFAMYAIIDQVIKQFSSKDFILDFEGSMIPGVAYFMKGFGAELEPYYIYEWNEHWTCKLTQKLKGLFRN